MIQSKCLFLETSTVHKYFMVNLVHVTPIWIHVKNKFKLKKFLYLFTLGHKEYLGAK